MFKLSYPYDNKFKKKVLSLGIIKIVEKTRMLQFNTINLLLNIILYFFFCFFFFSLIRCLSLNQTNRLIVFWMNRRKFKFKNFPFSLVIIYISLIYVETKRNAIPRNSHYVFCLKYSFHSFLRPNYQKRISFNFHSSESAARLN